MSEHRIHLYFICFNREFSYTWSGADGVLRYHNCLLRILFPRIATENHCYFYYPQILVWNCITSRLPGQCSPRDAITTKYLNFSFSFLSLFNVVATCISLIDVGEKLGECLFSCLAGKQQQTVVRIFGADQFEKRLSVPTTQIIECHENRPILDFLLMKLRTALDRYWFEEDPSSIQNNLLYCLIKRTLCYPN